MDQFKVVYRATFLSDFEQIIRAVADENPVAAKKLGLAILNVGDSLTLLPERFPAVRRRPGVRRYIVAKRFKVFYRVVHSDRRVEVLRCWDGRRGVDPVL